MKIIKSVNDDDPTDKKKSKKKKLIKKKQRKKMHFKNRNDLPESTSFFCSFDNDSVINESDSEILLTPSKSEGDSRNQLIPDFEENKDSFAFIEASFNNSVNENDSYTYNSVLDELIGSEVQNGDFNLAEEKSKSCQDENFELDQIENTQTEIIEDSSKPAVQYYNTDDGVVVTLGQNETLYFHGLMSVTVLHGEIEVLGYKITKNSPNAKLYSLRGAALLCLQNVTRSDVSVKKYLLTQNILDNVDLSENCAIILCKKLPDPAISFLEKHVSQQILPRYEATTLPRVIFQPKGNWNLYKPNEEWNNVIDSIHNQTRMIICGGKGVGKSTFLRYAINKLLMKFTEIQIVDLDPGQPEFTIPGCISIVKISEAIFGPNFTHLKKPERSLLSNINIAYEPEKYIESVKKLLEACAQDIPTLMNYMGYTHGIGINIVSAVITQAQPTDVVQINSENKKKNFKHLLTSNVVLTNAKLFMSSVPDFLDYRLHLLTSMCDQNDGWTAEARQLREMLILAYLSKMAKSNSLFKSTASLYRINLQQIKISDFCGKTIHPAAVNAGLVALCSLVEGFENIFDCRGLGIVRGIDMESNDLLLLTLEDASVLEKVYYIVLNSAQLPPSIFMTPDEVIGQMPYVTEGILMSFGQIPKRSRLPVKNKK